MLAKMMPAPKCLGKTSTQRRGPWQVDLLCRNRTDKSREQLRLYDRAHAAKTRLELSDHRINLHQCFQCAWRGHEHTRYQGRNRWRVRSPWDGNLESGPVNRTKYSTGIRNGLSCDARRTDKAVSIPAVDAIVSPVPKDPER